jgi:hypothetical protein
VAATACDHDTFDGQLTNQAWLPFATVDAVLQLKKSFLTIGVHVVRDGRTAERNGFFEHFLNGGVKPR